MINILIINVLSQHERLKNVRSRISLLNLSNAAVFNISAITPHNIPPKWLSKDVKFKKRNLSPGELACASSHIKALKAASLGGMSRIVKRFFIQNKEQIFKSFIYFLPALPAQISLILEDDVIFRPQAARVIEQISQIKNPKNLGAEILLLGHHLQLYADDGFLIRTPLRRRSLRTNLGHRWGKHAGMSVGAYCYAVGICGAKRLISQALPISRPADWLTHNNEQINALFASPELAICEHESSSTQENFSAKKRSKISKYFKVVKFYIKYFYPKNFT